MYSARAMFNAGREEVLAAAFHVFHNDWGKMPERGPRGVNTRTPLTGSGTAGAEYATLSVSSVGPGARR